MAFTRLTAEQQTTLALLLALHDNPINPTEALATIAQGQARAEAMQRRVEAEQRQAQAAARDAEQQRLRHQLTHDHRGSNKQPTRSFNSGR